MSTEIQESVAAVAHPAQERRYRPLIFLTTVALLLNIATWAVLFRRIPYTDGIIFLHYNIYYYIDLVGEWKQMWWVPGAGAVALVVNAGLVFIVRRIPQAIAVMTLTITLSLQLMLVVAAVLIVLLNY